MYSLKVKEIKHHPCWVKAVHASLVGWMFAALISTLMVMLHTIGFDPVKKLERIGIDIGMKIYSDIFYIEKPSQYEYIFVDVDQEACKIFSDNKIDLDPECLTSKPVPTSLITDFIRTARESQAAVIIIDVSPPEKHEESERRALENELAKKSNSKTWIIAPIYSRPGESLNGLVIDGDLRFDIVSSHASNRLRLASVTSYAENGVVRGYPKASCLVTKEGQRWVPTIPHLAALLIDPIQASAADRQYYDNIVSGKRFEVVDDVMPDCGRIKVHSEGSISASELFDPLAMTTIPPVIQFFFSLPRISVYPDTKNKEPPEEKEKPIYDRYVASKLIDLNCTHQHVDGLSSSPGCFSIEKKDDRFEGKKIIILGSSRAKAMDKVQTPTGIMSGSELILNATRAFLEFKPLQHTSPQSMLWNKLAGITIASGPMIIAWGLIFACYPFTSWIYRQLFLRSMWSKYAIFKQCSQGLICIFRSVMIVIIFVLGISIAYLLEIKLLLHPLKEGVAVDLLFPAVALALEGFAESAKIILSAFHRIIEISWEILRNILKGKVE